MLKLQREFRSAHPSAHRLANAVVNLPKKVEGGFVGSEFDLLWLIIEPTNRSLQYPAFPFSYFILLIKSGGYGGYGGVCDWDRSPWGLKI